MCSIGFFLCRTAKFRYKQNVSEKPDTPTLKPILRFFDFYSFYIENVPGGHITLEPIH